MSHNSIDLGFRRHLFIDDSLIDRAENVALRMNSPCRTGVAIVRDRAWEHHLQHPVSVVDEGGRARMWYQSSAMGTGNLESLGWFGYAESFDGITWTKPSLGLVEFNGTTDNNLTPPRPKRACVFRDPNAPPDEGYKTFGLTVEESIGPRGYGVFTSADGLSFMPKATNGIDLQGDTQNMAFWDDRLGRYVAYIRAFTTDAHGSWRRAVARWETDDLSSRDGWNLGSDELVIGNIRRISTQLPIVIACDELDPPDLDVYTPSVVKYPGAEDVYIATPSMYHHFADDEVVDAEPRRNDGLMEIQLAVSRDGISWTRPDRRPYVGIEPDGPASRRVYAAVGMVRRGDHIYQYYAAYDQSHGLTPRNNPGGQIRWSEQRLDGFVSLDAAYGGGELVTKPLSTRGRRLKLNIDTAAAGEARVEIQNATGRPLDGFRLADCDRILGNRVRYGVTWHGSPDIRLPTGAPIRLRIAMRGAKLYAIEFGE